MKIPTVYPSDCPRCGGPICFRITDAHLAWLPRERWECPHCEEVFSTQQWGEKASGRRQEGAEGE